MRARVLCASYPRGKPLGDATHSGRPEGRGCPDSARGTRRRTHHKIIIRLQCDDAVAPYISIAIDKDACIRVELEGLANTGIRPYIRDNGNSTTRKGLGPLR